MDEDVIRVLRIIEYVGPRRAVEEQVARSVHGTKRLPGEMTITATTLGEFPEILRRTEPKPFATGVDDERGDESTGGSGSSGANK